MLEVSTVIAFFLTSVLLALSPGPDNLFVMVQSMVQGVRAGLMVTIGLATGLVCHTAAVAFGVAVLFQTSQWAFSILKMLGAAYLLYLAWGAFQASAKGIGETKNVRLTLSALYTRGVIMNITNPKVSIFFLAFLPQFAQAQHGSITLQILMLGGLFIVAALLVFSLISLASGYLGHWYNRSPNAERILNRLTGTVFCALAIKLALTER